MAWETTPIMRFIKGMRDKGYGFADVNAILDAEYRNITDVWMEELEWRKRRGKNLILLWYGETGAGKSLSSIYWGAYWNKLWGYKFGIADLEETESGVFHQKPEGNIFFDRRDLLERIKNAKKGELFILDEEVAKSGVGSRREVELLQNIEKTVRQKQVSIIYNSPVLSQHVPHFLFRAPDVIDYNENLSKVILVKPVEEYFINKLYIGYITSRKPSKRFLDKYNKVKSAFIDKVLKMQVNSSVEFYKKLAQKYLDDKRMDKMVDSKGKIMKTLLKTLIMSEHPELAGTEVAHVVNLITLKKLDIEVGRSEDKKD